jgi:hypothetical protein
MRKALREMKNVVYQYNDIELKVTRCSPQTPIRRQACRIASGSDLHEEILMVCIVAQELFADVCRFVPRSLFAVRSDSVSFVLVSTRWWCRCARRRIMIDTWFRIINLPASREQRTTSQANHQTPRSMRRGRSVQIHSSTVCVRDSCHGASMKRACRVALQRGLVVLILFFAVSCRSFCPSTVKIIPRSSRCCGSA